ncbi:Plug domain-containing protein [Sphingomonas sp. J315]|nr:Plug domain-containing protein [Sphingomonas sp. J315]
MSPGWRSSAAPILRSAHPTAQGISLRGIGGNASSRALLLLDGVPQADPFGGWVPFPATLPQRLARVRVTRGGERLSWRGRACRDGRAVQRRCGDAGAGGADRLLWQPRLGRTGRDRRREARRRRTDGGDTIRARRRICADRRGPAWRGGSCGPL